MQTVNFGRLTGGGLAIRTVIATLLASSWSAVALAQSDAGADDSEQLEEIVVTGSRLIRSGFDTPSPVVMIGTEEIRSSTSPALGDLLNDLPQLRTTFGLGNSSRFIGTAGIGSLDLRGLGTERTLVLINGRRHVSASEGQQDVDVNSIPTDMIERIEIITGANSAVYGADAVAGVVNFILKDNYEGASFRASTGDADDSGFGRNSFAFTMGKNFSDNRGNAIFSLGYEDQDLLQAGERGGDFTRLFGEVANPLDGDTIDADGNQIDDGIPDRITVPNRGFWAISNAGTSLDLDGFLNPDGSFSPIPHSSFEFPDGLACGGQGCVPLDTQTFQVLQAEFQRFTLDANFTYDVRDNLEWYFEGRYANVDSGQVGQPTFDFFSGLGVNRDNPFVSPSLGAAMDAAGLSFVDLNRFNVDLGHRQEQNNRETFRAVTGLQGEFGESWHFDVFANYGRTTVERVNLNNRIDERWAAAVDAISIDATQAADLRDSGLAPLAAAGDIVCRSTLQEAQGEDSGLPDFAYAGCVPANVLGFGLISQEAKDFINSTALGLSEIQQTQYSATVSNPELIDHWAGSISGVLGVEYREEQSAVRGDSLSALGNTFFNNLASTVGDFDVSEVFTEFAVPLLQDVPGAQDLTFEGAVRYSDYSTIGDTVTWEARLSWQPIEDLRFRFNVGEALRAPTIGDLFSPAGENFNIIDDPCDMDNLDLGTNGRNVRVQNCQALGIADPATFDSADESSITLKQGGNPNLSEEVADTFTIGVVYTPRWAENLSISLDWYDIEIEDAISFTDSQSILDKCVDDLNGINNQFCALVTRDSIGNVAELRRSPLNLNRFETSGLDFEIDYTVDIGSAGTLRNRLIGSFLNERTSILSSSDNIDLLVGELGDPEWQVNYRGSFLRDNWEVYAELRWIDSMFIEEQELLFGRGTNTDPNPDVTDNTIAESVLYVDLGATYNFGSGLEIGVVVDNITDEDPPFGLFGNGGQSGLYDSIGRFYVVRATWSFGDQ